MTEKLLIGGKLLLCLLIISCGIFCSCGGQDDDPQYNSISLVPDTDRIDSDGQDAVFFTVEADGYDITKKSVIMLGEERLPGFSFTSTVAGTYSFTATYKDLKSNTVTVTVGSPAIASLVLLPDKTDIISNGSDKVTFTVNHNGDDITSDAKISGDYSGNLDPGGSGYSFTTNDYGEFSFYAEYNGIKSPTVNVSAFPENGEFQRMVGFFKTTSIHCEPCTGYAANLKTVEQQMPETMTIVSIHGNMTSPDPMAPDNFYELIKGFVYGSTSFPSSNFDFREKYHFTGSQTVSVIQQYISEIINENPATTGFYVNSEVDGDKAEITVTVRATTTGNYFLGAVLIEDGIIGTQADYEGEYIHDNTFRQALTPAQGIDLRTIEAGKTVTKQLQVDLKGFEKNNCRLVLYTLVPDGSGVKVVNNACYASLRGITNYRLK